MKRLLTFCLCLCLLLVTSAGTSLLALVGTFRRAVAEQPRETTVIFVGDIMTSREVGRRLRNVPNQPLYPFEKIKPYLNTADFAFGNLETPVVEGELVGPYSFQFRSDPDVVRRLKESGFRLISLANNHLHDFGKKGLTRTVELFEDAGLAAAGAGRDDAQAYAPVIIEKNGIRFALLAYVETALAPRAVRATQAGAGMAVMDIPKMTEGVRSARERFDADIVIVSMHAGTEYTQQLRSSQTDFAHAAVDAGADLVVGHHPHVPQRTELYNGKHIFYSLGNFVFDQMWSEETRHGMTARITFVKDGVKNVEMVPIYIERDYQPALLPAVPSA